MSEYTDLIREARESLAMIGVGDWTPQDLVAVRVLDALEASVARTAELETVIRSARLASTQGNLLTPPWVKDALGAVSL